MMKGTVKFIVVAKDQQYCIEARHGVNRKMEKQF